MRARVGAGDLDEFDGWLVRRVRPGLLCRTKAALIGFGKILALEGAQSGVTSNVVAPNIAVDELADMSIEELEEFDSYFARIARATPMRALGREADVANLVTYLASGQASYITGQVVGVTGGVDLFSF